MLVIQCDWLGPRGAFKAVLILLALLFAFGAGRADAAIISCSLSTNGMTFSAYDTVTAAAVDSTGSISVTCTGSGNENLQIAVTGGNSGVCDPRRMLQAAAALNYQAYRDSSRSTFVCNQDRSIAVTFNFDFGSTQTKTLTIYGRVFSGQNPSLAGAYSDNLTATLQSGGGASITSISFPVNGSVAATCSLTTATLGFDTYTQAVLDAASSVTVKCTNSTAYSVSINEGQNLSSGIRRMAGPSGSFLNYQLFRDSARTAPWGDGTSLGEKVTRTGTGANQSLTVFGRIPANQSVRPGSYTDTVQVTVTY